MAKKIPIPNADRAVKDFIAASQERMQYGKHVYQHQNEAARDAIDRMQSLLIRQSRTYMKVNKVSVEIPKEAIWNNSLYMAVEILKDLAFMDIRVAGFSFPSDRCVECGAEIKSRKVRRG